MTTRRSATSSGWRRHGASSRMCTEAATCSEGVPHVVMRLSGSGSCFTTVCRFRSSDSPVPRPLTASVSCLRDYGMRRRLRLCACRMRSGGSSVSTPSPVPPGRQRRHSGSAHRRSPQSSRPQRSQQAHRHWSPTCEPTAGPLIRGPGLPRRAPCRRRPRRQRTPLSGERLPPRSPGERPRGLRRHPPRRSRQDTHLPPRRPIGRQAPPRGPLQNSVPARECSRRRAGDRVGATASILGRRAAAPMTRADVPCPITIAVGVKPAFEFRRHRQGQPPPAGSPHNVIGSRYVCWK